MVAAWLPLALPLAPAGGVQPRGAPGGYDPRAQLDVYSPAAASRFASNHRAVWNSPGTSF